MQVIECSQGQLEILAGLFNDYRIFYGHQDDVPACRDFLEENLRSRRSSIFLLSDDIGNAVAFAQCYPAICSLNMRPYQYLSDLYVVPSARKQGHGHYLMQYLRDHFTRLGAQRITLDTATTNKIAQQLYESLGYEREQLYITYHQMLDTPLQP
ncbi:GNAT family N-acetyltransferase [uncultured Herbaspirillum sp.]|uniref:GNAT family N-acetyltransferase n=1 Tax=uncultured Herbaspirillum sp. TaxID=160236 RepID=UPI00258B5880|nr:GNAT family N-acetyltransferase [uncultured Herbaspirillum sp.]